MNSSNCVSPSGCCQCRDLWPLCCPMSLLNKRSFKAQIGQVSPLPQQLIFPYFKVCINVAMSPVDVFISCFPLQVKSETVGSRTEGQTSDSCAGRLCGALNLCGAPEHTGLCDCGGLSLLSELRVRWCVSIQQSS